MGTIVQVSSQAIHLHFVAVLCKGKRASLSIYDTLNILDVARVKMSILGLNT